VYHILTSLFIDFEEEEKNNKNQCKTFRSTWCQLHRGFC